MDPGGEPRGEPGSDLKFLIEFNFKTQSIKLSITKSTLVITSLSFITFNFSVVIPSVNSNV